MTTRITLPPDCATIDELWEWIENVTPLIEAFNTTMSEGDEVARSLGLRAGAQSRLFALLHSRMGQCVANETLCTCATRELSDGCLKVYIYNIRRILDGTGYQIENVRNTGYVMYPPPQEASAEMAA